MKKNYFFVIILVVVVSSCAKQPAVAESVLENTTAATTDAESRSESISAVIFRDMEGVEVERNDVAELRLNYAYGWNINSGGSYEKIERDSTVNDFIVSKVFSVYNQPYSGSGANNSNGYTLSAKTPFGTVEEDVIFKKSDMGWSFYVVRDETDTYFPEITAYSEERSKWIKNNCSIELDGESVPVQPMEIALSDSSLVDEYNTDKTVFRARAAVSSINVSSYSQASPDDCALIASSYGFISEII